MNMSAEYSDRSDKYQGRATFSYDHALTLNDLQ